ncbi:metallophosphoesterase [Odoribacter sp. OttesenSCG-928-J03]|nr:metallophosphoesterase [Odoribacter sp. OttesenSCG-928-J03]MDL2283485.1 metallophosphoesterase [Odoribacter sp. OttesenSCG-928-G04]MDL2330674.1 metallophosphoesterase [Odoribacter sp. OttesenSCG-928-A06]
MRSELYIILSGIFFILLTDGLFYFQLKKFLRRKRIAIPYWLVTLVFIIGFILFHFSIKNIKGPEFYYWVAWGSSMVLLFYVPKSILIITNALAWFICHLFRINKNRRLLIPAIFTSICFLILLYSVTLGKSNYKVEREEIAFQNLPAGFDKLKIIQISDLHLGSLAPTSGNIPKLVKTINQLKPDLILFTGDMINNFSTELLPWIDDLNQLQATYGQYAILGNHDYGDYIEWDTPEARLENLNQLKVNMANAGFKLLNNEHAFIASAGDTLCIAGVENWGKPPFPQYGDLKKAIAGAEHWFTVLMSHDPSHWKAEIINYNIPLTLAGHTHAMQMGFKIGNYEWSPAKYIYEEYDGLYEENGKYIYVSRGVGYLGFAGRIGLRPQIVEITLKQAE